MNPFKAGDVVTCHAYQAVSPFKPGLEYTITRVNPQYVYFDDNPTGGWYYGRFKLVLTVNSTPTNRFKEGERLKCWIVVRVGVDGRGSKHLAPNSKPAIHRSEASAEGEARRLSEKHPDIEFVIFKALSVCKADKPAQPHAVLRAL